MQAAGSYYPSAWDVDSGAFGEVHGQVAVYLTASMPLEPTLALRVGGKKVWGAFPFQEAAFIGGRSTVRGFQEQRFAGDGSLYGNAELRLYLSRSSGWATLGACISTARHPMNGTALSEGGSGSPT